MIVRAVAVELVVVDAVVVEVGVVGVAHDVALALLVLTVAHEHGKGCHGHDTKHDHAGHGCS